MGVWLAASSGCHPFPRPVVLIWSLIILGVSLAMALNLSGSADREARSKSILPWWLGGGGLQTRPGYWRITGAVGVVVALAFLVFGLTGNMGCG